MATSQATPDIPILSEAFPDGVPVLLARLVQDSAFSRELSEFSRLATSKSIGKSDEHYRRTTLSDISSRMFKRGVELISDPFGQEMVQLRKFDISLENIRVRYVLQRQGVEFSAPNNQAKQPAKRRA